MQCGGAKSWGRLHSICKDPRFSPSPLSGGPAYLGMDTIHAASPTHKHLLITYSGSGRGCLPAMDAAVVFVRHWTCLLHVLPLRTRGYPCRDIPQLTMTEITKYPISHLARPHSAVTRGLLQTPVEDVRAGWAASGQATLTGKSGGN